MVEEFGKLTGKLIKTSEDIVHANGDVREEISDRFFQFVATNQELVMLDVNNEINPMISKDKVIWYDDEFYYLTDAMLRTACEKVLEVVSVNELKAILREEGILYCDASGDYSIKIIVKTQNGQKRPRVLKLRKLYLTVDGEGLECFLHLIYQDRTTVIPYLIHHVQCENHRNIQFHQLHGQVQVSFNIGCIHNIDDSLWMFI